MTFEEKNVLNINNGILALFHFYNGIEANPINFKEDLECIFSLYKNDYRYRNDENKYFLIEVSERMLHFEYLINKDKVWRLEGTDDEPEGMQEFVKVYCDAYNASLEVHWYFEELYPNEFIGYDEIPIPEMSIDYNLQQKDPEKPKPEPKETELSERIKKHFGFFNRNCPRKHKQILNDTDFEKLIEWTIWYFENDFKVPEISEPIKVVNTNKTFVQLAFKYLFKELHKSSPYPETLFEFYRSAFNPYSEDKKRNFERLQNKDEVKKLMQIDY